jgi:ABC-type sugar transport system ATPase subunit
MTPPAARPDAPLLQARGVGKSYPGVRALAGVDFSLRCGEVAALVGENGAGKSTLMKVLAGVVQPDDGQILLDGRAVRLAGPADALRAGIALIHQELSLCDNLTVAGALFLGAELRRGPFLRRRAMRSQAREWLQRVGLAVDPDALVAGLAPGHDVSRHQRREVLQPQARPLGFAMTKLVRLHRLGWRRIVDYPDLGVPVHDRVLNRNPRYGRVPECTEQRGTFFQLFPHAFLGAAGRRLMQPPHTAVAQPRARRVRHNQVVPAVVENAARVTLNVPV